MDNGDELRKAALVLAALKAGAGQEYWPRWLGCSKPYRVHHRVPGAEERYAEGCGTTPLEALADWAAAARLKPEYAVIPRDIAVVILAATWGEEWALLRIDEVRDILLAALGE